MNSPSNLLVHLVEVGEGFVSVLGAGDGLDHLVHAGHVGPPDSLLQGSSLRVQGTHAPQHLGVLGCARPDALRALEAVRPDRQTELGAPRGLPQRGRGDDYVWSVWRRHHPDIIKHN